MNMDEATELVKRMKLGKGKHEIVVCKNCSESFCLFCSSSSDVDFCSKECEEEALAQAGESSTAREDTGEKG